MKSEEIIGHLFSGLIGFCCGYAGTCAFDGNYKRAIITLSAGLFLTLFRMIAVVR